MNRLMRSIKAGNLELQFWGYEVGNLFAAVAGSGGFARFAEEINAVLSDPALGPSGKLAALAGDHPDVFVTIALGAIVLLAPPLRSLIARGGRPAAVNAFDVVALVAAVAILLFTLRADTSWLTDAAAAFVVGSSLLRQSKRNPFLMKPGGLALALGGFSLAAFGLIEVADDVETSDAIGLALSAIAFLTGVYVLAAGLLTYQGGVFETARFVSEAEDGAKDAGWTAGLLDPRAGLLPGLFERLLDPAVTGICDHAVKPAIVWVPRRIRAQKPFATSMWARLPWRLVSGALAFAALTPQGFAFGLANGCWAIGDVAIGSLDWEDDA